MDSPQPAAPSMWRPLGFGELFDRTITLYFRNFLPFVYIALGLAIPSAVLGYFVDSAATGANSPIGQMQQILHRSAGAPPPVSPLFSTPREALLTVCVGLVLVLASTFVYLAIAVGVGRLYAGKPVEFRACYETALRRWPSIVGALLMIFLIAIAAVIAIAIAVGMSVAITILMAFLPLTIVVASVLYLSAIGVLLVLSVAMTLALYTIVIEDAPVFAALGSGFARAFSKAFFWRAMGLIVCAVVIEFLALFLLQAAGQIALYFGLVWITTVLNAIVQALSLPFSGILFAVFYFDIRIRREGLDLQAVADQLAAPALE
jgi:hypothetical protein